MSVSLALAQSEIVGGHGALDFRAARRSHPLIATYYQETHSRLTANHFNESFSAFPFLRAAALSSLEIQAAVLVTLVAFEGQDRENRPEPLSHHSLRVADRVAELLTFVPIDLAGKTTAIIKALTHDLKEDRHFMDGFLRTVFLGNSVASGVERLSIYPSKFRDPSWLRRAEGKRMIKFAQAAKLKPDELLIKAVDSIDNLQSDLDDFNAGRLLVANGKVIFLNGSKKPVELEEFKVKLAHRAEHHADYMRRLAADPAYAILTPILNRRFEKVSAESGHFLRAPQPQPANNNELRDPRSTRRALLSCGVLAVGFTFMVGYSSAEKKGGIQAPAP